MSILVTGGAGFIGSHLCEHLAKLGRHVVCIDNFDNFYPQEDKKRNREGFRSHPSITFVEGDIRHVDMMTGLFAKHAFSSVFHLAGRGGVPQSAVDPLVYLNETVRTTLHILEMAARHKVQLFVNASSSAVYGRRSGASAERVRTDRPLSVYGALKRSTEMLCHAYCATHGIGTINVRLFSVYGPRGRPDQVVYSLTRMIDTGQPVPIVVPDPRRDFTYVTDIVDGLSRLLSLPPSCNETINLGYGEPQPIRRVIKLVERALDKKAVKGDTVRRLPSDIPSSHADNNRARKLLGWKPAISIDTGIPTFVQWYREKQPSNL